MRKGRPKDERNINNNDKFWFKPSLIESGSNDRIDDQILRERFEVLLIKFLKRNAIANKHMVDRQELYNLIQVASQ